MVVSSWRLFLCFMLGCPSLFGFVLKCFSLSYFVLSKFFSSFTLASCSYLSFIVLRFSLFSDIVRSCPLSFSALSWLSWFSVVLTVLSLLPSFCILSHSTSPALPINYLQLSYIVLRCFSVVLPCPSFVSPLARTY